MSIWYTCIFHILCANLIEKNLLKLFVEICVCCNCSNTSMTWENKETDFNAMNELMSILDRFSDYVWCDEEGWQRHIELGTIPMLEGRVLAEVIQRNRLFEDGRTPRERVFVKYYRQRGKRRCVQEGATFPNFSKEFGPGGAD